MNDQQKRDQQRQAWKDALAEVAKANRRNQARPRRRTGLAAAGRAGMVRLMPPGRRQDGQDGPGAA